MYKAKLEIWGILIVIGLVISLIGKIDFSSTVYTVSSNLEDDFLDRFDEFSKSGIELQTSMSPNSDIIVHKASNNTIDGYTKYPAQFYTDLIVYIQTNGYCGNSCAFYENTDASISSFSNIMNLKSLLVAFENDKTYKELGLIEIENDHIDENYIKLENKIKLYLPSKGVYYYDEVKNLIAYVLNDYTVENIENEEIQTRVENIFNKAAKYDSDKELRTLIINDTNVENRGIFIGPAYIKDSSVVDITPDGYYHFLSFHPAKTLDITYDLYTLNNETDYEEFFNILTTERFFYDVGLKNIEANFNKSYVYRLNEYK